MVAENRDIPWFSKYLTNHFYISKKKGEEALSLSIDSISLKDDAMFIEMSGDLKGKPKSLYIYSALLSDIFPDQTNLVIFEYRKKETGIKFDVRKHDEVLLLK